MSCTQDFLTVMHENTQVINTYVKNDKDSSLCCWQRETGSRCPRSFIPRILAMTEYHGIPGPVHLLMTVQNLCSWIPFKERSVVRKYLKDRSLCKVVPKRMSFQLQKWYIKCECFMRGSPFSFFCQPSVIFTSLYIHQSLQKRKKLEMKLKPSHCALFFFFFLVLVKETMRWEVANFDKSSLLTFCSFHLSLLYLLSWVSPN